MLKENYGTVITGDIVASQKMILAEKDKILEDIRNAAEYYLPHSFYFDVFRGDSFQLVTNNRFSALRFCLLIKSKFLKESKDVSISMASSEISRWPTEKLQAEGKALVKSGRGLEYISSTGSRFLVQFEEKEYKSKEQDSYPKEFGVHSIVLDNIMKNWTRRQAEIVYQILLQRKHKDQSQIATELGVSQQAISKILISSKWEIVKSIIDRYEFCVNMNYDIRVNIE